MAIETSKGRTASDAEKQTPDEWTVTQDRRPETPPSRGGLSPYRWMVTVLRRSWRGLTSMRTALILLFLLAVAAIPGSLLPQKNIDIEKVEQFHRDHASIAPLLDKTGFFNVFSSVWFSAIYLLLFISLIGCVTPRLRAHWIAMRRQPPDAPARLARMPVSASDLELAGPPADAANRVAALLKGRRYRTVVRTHDDGVVTVSAEKGYLKETGNLLFHFSLIALLVGVAFGSWYGWHANRILVAGPDTAFCDTLTQFDDYSLGSRLDGSDLSPFCVRLDSFKASYLPNGQPTQYTAKVQYAVGAGSNDWKPDTLEVNKPLRLPHANVYLLGHGYAPIVKFTDKYGVSQTRVSPFLPIDGADTSTGVAQFPDANIDPKTGSNTDPATFTKQQVGFSGVYVPTAANGSAVSAFPAENNPVLVLTPYIGDLGLDNGVPQSVYELNMAEVASGALKPMKHVEPGSATLSDQPIRLKPGETATLSDGSTVEFVGTRPFATLSIRYDPGEKIVLGGAIALVVGLLLSLTGRRRRIWFRVSPSPGSSPGPPEAGSAGVASAASDQPGESDTVKQPSGSVAQAGGLARAEYASFPVEFQSIIKSAGGE